MMCFAKTILNMLLPSAQRSATSLATAPRLVDTVEDTVETKVDMAVVSVDVEAAAAVVDKPATLAVDTDTCLVSLGSIFSCAFYNNFQVTAPKAKSATTVAKLVICPATAPPRPPPSELATSASSPVTSRPSAPTKIRQ